MLNQPLAGKIAIVTGGGTGIGAAITRDFVAAGARVCISGRRQTFLDEIANSLAAGSAKTCAGDVANRFDVERMVSTALTFNGTIDVLVNNAGFGVQGGILDLELSDWQRAIDVNLTGPFLMMKATVLHMLKARHGSIINISSIAGLRGTPGTSAYAAAKGGLNMLTQPSSWGRRTFAGMWYAPVPCGPLSSMEQWRAFVMSANLGERPWTRFMRRCVKIRRCGVSPARASWRASARSWRAMPRAS